MAWGRRSPRFLQLHQGCGIFTGTYYAANVLQHVYIVEHQLLLWQLREVPSDATAPVRYHTPADGHLPTRCIAQPRGGATVSLVCVIILFCTLTRRRRPPCFSFVYRDRPSTQLTSYFSLYADTHRPDLSSFRSFFLPLFSVDIFISDGSPCHYTDNYG